MMIIPSESFGTREEMCSILIDSAKTQGYAVSILRSVPNVKVTFKCDRGGTKRMVVSEEERKQATSSRLNCCPFRLNGCLKLGKWTLHVINDKHNHPPTNAHSHPSLCRLSQFENAEVVRLAGAAISPKKIYAALKQSNPDSTFTKQHIYNNITKDNIAFLRGRSPTQAFLEELDNSEWIYALRTENSKISCLFITHPHSIEMSRRYHKVLLMDCTYKTNCYKMPLLDVVGINCFNKTFFSCFVFLSEETTENYVWALKQIKHEIFAGTPCPQVIATDRELALMNAIDQVFSTSKNILCRWHINKNIAAKCKKYFEAGEVFESFLLNWNLIVNCTLVDDFYNSWTNFKGTFCNFPRAIEYLSTTWWIHKERFAAPWVNNYFHLESVNTSRVEGANSVIKQFLKNSRSSFRGVKNKLELAILSQYDEFTHQWESEQSKVLHFGNHFLFKNLNYKVSFFALKKIQQQLMKAESGSVDCSGYFKTCLGLPCNHFIKNKLTQNEALLLNEVDSFWHLGQSDFEKVESILEENDTQIDLISTFERVQQAYMSAKSHQKEAAKELLEHAEKILLNDIQPPSEVNVKKRGRPVGAKNQNSTKRDLSLFEHDEMKKGRMCRICKKRVGHNAATCPERK